MMGYNDALNIYNQKLEEKEFARIQDFMLNKLGVKLSPIKIVMVNSRLIKRLKASEIYNFPDYINYVFSFEGKRSGELQCMIDELTTHKTEFYRESEHFDFLKNIVLPEFFKNGKRNFSIWSAGSSTGEEAFTMGMILNDFKIFNAGFDFSILASDVSNAVVVKATEATYLEKNIATLAPNIVRRYFVSSKDVKDNTVQVVKLLKDKVKFSVLNLVDNYPYPNNSLDVIFCRNTLIYFEDKAKREVVNKLISKIKPGGYLFVGLSETVSQYSSEIKQVSPSVYKKIDRSNGL
ncbi:MAG: methyltransferase domain-containing protein [Prolixibacteraceae bacterium]|jgi:chemotaxis protein methyltransferase CheR|nr:methyltransferase domain-containing protein [Prolixibacteraceae bacterium]